MKSQFSIFFLLVFISACSSNEPAENEADDLQADAVPVYVEELAPSTFRHYINVQGTVESDKTIMVTPKAAATVQEILVRAGDEVNPGDVLAMLDGEITRAQLREVETQLELARTLYERQQNLSEQNIGSEVELLQAKTQAESLENQLATLREQYEDYTIRASIGGTVNRVSLKVGEMVNTSTPVFQIANSEALKVVAEISEAYISRVEQTDSVRITFPSFDGIIEKNLDVVSKVIELSNRTFLVEVYIPNMDGQVRPNMIANVRINDYKQADQIVVPLNTVRQTNGTDYVYVAEETDSGWRAVQKDVNPGLNYADMTLISEGLSAGQLLITAGYNDISDGDLITIQEN